MFEADNKRPHCKVVVADAQIQTDTIKRFRLGIDGKIQKQISCNYHISIFYKLILILGLEDVEKTKDLIDTLKFSLQTCSIG